MAKRLKKKSIAEEMRDRATGNNQTYTVEERKDVAIPKQDMTPTPTLQDRINKHYVENMQNLANTTMNMVTNTVKRNPIVNSFMAGFNTGKNVELPQNQVKTIQNAVKKDLQTNTQDKRNPYTIMQDKNNQKKEEEEQHKKDVSYKPYQLPQAQAMVNKNQQEVDERKKNEEAQGLLSQVQNRTLPQAQKQEEAKKPTLTESIEEYLRTGDIRKSAGNYFKSQFEGGKQGAIEFGQYYNETLPSKVEGDSWTKRKSEEQYRAKEYREGLLNDVKQNPDNYSKEQKSFIKNQQEFTEKYGDNFYEAYKNESKEKVNKMIEEAPTEIDRKLIEIGQSNGRSTVGAGFSMLSPVAGTMYFYGSSAQSYYDSALEMGMAESDAWKYANVMGAWETVSEELIAANRVDQVNKILTGSNIGKTGMKFLGNSMVENAFQEALSEPIDDITKSMLNYSYLNEGQLGERMLESGMIGAISALLMDSPTAVLSAPGDIVNLYNKSVEKIGKKATIEKMQKGAETYYAQILSEINNGLGNDAYEMMRNQNIQEENELSRLLPGQYENQQEIDRTRDEKLKAITEDMTEGDKTAYLIQNSNLSQEEKDSLSRVARKLNVSAEQIDDLLKFNEEQKQIQSESKELEQMIDNSNLTKAQIGEVFAQKSFEEAKNKINELNEENNANQEAIKTLGLNISEENKEGNISYKEKQNIEINDSDTLESSYKKYFGENETTFVKRLKNLDKAAIESGQNVKLVFDGNYFKDDNGNILTGVEAAFVTKDGKRVIAVNPYATTGKAFEQVLAHELTHAVLSEENADTQALYKSVQDYLTSKGEYDNIVKDLKGLYGKNYNEEEVVAKTIERLFNSKEELNSLANAQPNIFTRIYRSLVGMYAKITGSEKAYIKKLKLDMELAWKNSNNKGSLQDTIKNSITETSTTDSQGRTLTKEQQEFFKDSKVRDENGKLLLLHHGTDVDFNTFEHQYIGEDNKDGLGFYFTPNELQFEYDNPKTVYVNITNPATDGNLIDRIIRREEELLETIKDKKQVLEQIQKEFNVDGIIDKNRNNIVAFNSNQIKNVDNKKPTTDPDIRYSIEPTNKDSQGRTLSEQQQNYFKDSKVRDKDGNLLEVYHGTPTGGFTVYDNSKLGSTTGAKDSGLGIHFTNNPDMASIYKDYVSDEALNGEIKKLYEKYGKDFDSTEEYNREKWEFDNEHSEEIAEIRERLYKEQEGKGEVKKQYINITKPLSVFADYGIDNKQLADDWVYALTGSTDITDTTDYYEDNEEFLDAIQSNWNNELAEAKDELATPEAKERLQELGYDGLILPLQNTDVAGLAELKTQGGEEFKDIQLDGNEYIVFDSNQAKNIDNTNPTSDPDIRYSIETTTDNDGNKLSKGQREYFNGSKAVDENGNLVKVYHTTGSYSKIAQFNTFDPRIDNHYHFGSQIVNYYTDDQHMSGSYADQKYKAANTQKIESMEDVNNYLNSLGEYEVNKRDDGSYEVKQLNGNDDFARELDELEKSDEETYDQLLYKVMTEGIKSGYNLFGISKKLDDFLYELDNRYGEYTAGETARELIDYINNMYGEGAIFDNEDDLYRNLQEKIQKKYPKGKTGAWQYSGYVNLQNPYIIDAEGRAWSKIKIEEGNVSRAINELSDETKKELTKIAKESVKRYENAKKNYRKIEDTVYYLSTEPSNYGLSRLAGQLSKLVFNTRSWNYLDKFLKQKGDKYEVWRANAEMSNIIEDMGLWTPEERITYRETAKMSQRVIDNIKTLLDEELDDNSGRTIYQVFKELSKAATKKYEYDDENNYIRNKLADGRNDKYSSFYNYLWDPELYRIDLTQFREIAENGFNKEEIVKRAGKAKETNDIVKEVLEKNAEIEGGNWWDKNYTQEQILKMGGYDGVIIKNTLDYGGVYDKSKKAPHDLYITFGSEQFKAADNKNPTLDKDIRYSEQTETADEILDRLLEKYRGKGERTYLPGIPKNLPKDYIMELGNKIEQMSMPDDKKLELYNLANTNDWNEESYNNFMTDLDAIEQDFKNQQQRDRFNTKTYDNPDRAKLITKKHNEFNKDYHYNDKLVDEIDSLLPRNRNGKRTVKDWKRFAYELGKRMGMEGYNPDEIEDIAVKSYYDLQPSKNITKYDNKAKKSVGFERLYANDWVNSVYEGLNEAGYDATKFSITDNGQNNEQPVLPKKELSNKLPVGQVNESKEDSLNAIREHHERELGDTINLEDIQNLPDLKGDKLEGDLPKTIDRIVDKRTKEKVTVKEFIKELKKQFVNKAYAVDKLAKQTGNKKLTHKYDRQLMAFNEAQVSLGDAQVNKDGRVVGKSLIETFKKAKDTGLDKVFADYLENKNNIARDKLGESLYGADVTAVQSRKIVEEYEKKYPQFKEWANDVSRYNDNLAESYLVGSFINQELWNKLKQLNPDYVPAFRDIVETKGLSDSVDNVGFQVLKRAEGGSSKILTPKEAMAEQTVNYVKAYRKNETIKELYKTIKGKLDSTDILYEDMETVPEIAYEMMREAVGKDQDGHYTATFFENGKATTFKVGKDIFDAFVQGKGIEAIEKNAITKVLGGTTRNIAQFQRNAVTTYSIPFLLKNMVRDYNDALINTQYSDLRFMKNYARAYIEMVTKGKYYEQYKNAGGGANTYYDYDRGLLPGNTKNPLKKFMNKVVSLNEYIETAPRLAEFISTMEKGGNLDEALYNAAEITTNFKRGGDTAKLINKYGANFFNASIQGADKVIRNITGQKGLKGYANLAVKTMIAGVAPSLLNHILISGSDDPEERKAYEELQDYIKNNYYLIYKGNGDFYRIPKGRIAGTIGAAAVGLYRTTQGEDDAFDGYFKNVLLENLAPNNPLTNNIIAPVLQAKGNDAWYDGTIYSETKYANKLPMEVTDEKVDDFSNLVAKGVNALFDDETLMKSKTNNGWLDILANPKKLNYVLDQYSGGFGDIVLPQLTPRAENNFIADQFTTSSVLKNKYVGEFYDMCDNNIGNSEYATDFDKLTYKYLNGMSKEVGGLYKEKHEIEQSDLPDDEKMKQSREKQKEINELCKEAVETVKGTKVTGNTAEFGGQTYYKDNEDEWKKISEDSEMNMLYTVDATTYADWKNKTTAANKAKKESEGKGLTDKEKDAMLVNSTYRDEEKEAIYMDSMGKDDDVYKALKIIAQPDIDEYLTYQSQTFESDRVDDGTAKGKAVTKGEGTSKNKTINYLDNSNMSSAETEYIKATKYKLDSTTALRNYIDSLNLSEEEYRTVMSNIKDSNVVELSDGTWKWK